MTSSPALFPGEKGEIPVGNEIKNPLQWGACPATAGGQGGGFKFIPKLPENYQTEFHLSSTRYF